jgi:hypothetical protein
MQACNLVHKAGFTDRWHTHPCAHGNYRPGSYCFED